MADLKTKATAIWFIVFMVLSFGAIYLHGLNSDVDNITSNEITRDIAFSVKIENASEMLPLIIKEDTINLIAVDIGNQSNKIFIFRELEILSFSSNHTIVRLSENEVKELSRLISHENNKVFVFIKVKEQPKNKDNK